ncbi:MAG: SMP-30/gluconolactonase/LRE family protein [Nevskia sp.]|nr:SMP-30/gluconolactonase/LRE family protein [Nevskia sp.]
MASPAHPGLTTLAGGFTFLECPRWHQGRLWLSDFYSHRVVAVDAKGTVETIARVPQQPSGLGFLPDGRALIVSMRDRKLLRREPSGALVEHADLSKLAPHHLNDMLVDAKGRAWVGNFGFDLMAGAPMASTVLIRVDADGKAQVAAHGLRFPNGMAMTPDGRTLVVAESFGQSLAAFTVGADGSLSNQRIWAQIGEPPKTTDAHAFLGSAAIVPDGICLDAEGAIWVADALHHRAVRVAEGGRILEEISSGETGVYACMLGGDDGRTLFLCAAPSFGEEERKQATDAEILAVRVKVPHAGLP